MRPSYVTEATLLVPARNQGNQQERPIRPDVLFQTQGWVELVKTSYIVLDNVVRDLRLYVPEATADSAALGTFALKDRFRPGSYDLKVSDDGRAFELAADGGVSI